MMYNISIVPKGYTCFFTWTTEHGSQRVLWRDVEARTCCSRHLRSRMAWFYLNNDTCVYFIMIWGLRKETFGLLGWKPFAVFCTLWCFGGQVWRSWRIMANKECMTHCNRHYREMKSDSQRLELPTTLLCVCVWVCECVLVISVRFWAGATVRSHLTITCHCQQMFTRQDYLPTNHIVCVYDWELLI